MKTTLILVSVVVATILFVVMVGYTLRIVDQISTPVTVINPVAGISCVQVSNEHGVAVSCWKD